MKKNTLIIEIKCPIGEVFQFTLNPTNTPKWIKSVIEEKTSDKLVKVGTIYSQKTLSSANQISETAFVITGFIENKQLDFHLVNGKYTCSYIYENIHEGTRLTYSEEAGVDGNLEDPLNISALETLKQLLEK